MRMGLRSLMVFGVITGMGLAAMAAESKAPSKGPALSKQRYDLIMGNLDAGGDLLVVANMDGWIKGAIQKIVTPIMALGGDSPEFKPVADCLSKLPGFLDKNGFYGFQGFGTSIAPRADGLNNIKCFIARDPAVAWSPLWQAMVGGNPRTMVCANFLPADTELACTGTGESSALWKMVRSGVAELATPAAAAAFDTQLSSLATNMGVDLDKMFASMGGEGFFSIQFSKSATINLPGGNPTAPVQMPEPSFLMGVAVKDNTLVASLEAALAKVGMMAVTNGGEAAGVKTLNIPLPLPVPLEPSYTVHAGFFLLGSTPAVVVEGVKAFKAKSGLVSTPAFNKAFDGLPKVNNGISYMSPRFMNTIMDIQQAMIPRDSGPAGKAKDLMNDMMGFQRDMIEAKVLVNRRNGIAVVGVSSIGSKQMMASVMMAPIGMMAGIAIPSFMKARTTSQMNACINNLRMIEAAKEQWALSSKIKEGDPVVESAVLEYIKGGKMPVCPQGGKYSLNAVGANCQCTVPGHELE